VTLSLPDEVRAALTDAGLSDGEVQLKTGDELREAIGDRLTYELVVALAGQRLTVARSGGWEGHLPPDDLIERNLDILRLRIVEKMTFAAIGREVGLTHGRIPQILRTYYGVETGRGRKEHKDRVLTIPAASVPMLREAFLGRLQGAAEDLEATVRAGDDGWYAMWHAAQEVVNLLLEVQKDKDTTIKVGKRRAIITKALRDHADARRNLSDEDGAAICERLLAAT